MNRGVAIGSIAATVILLALAGGDDEELPSVGFQPPQPDDEEDEARLLAATPVDLTQWIGKDRRPECGCFFQWRRGDMLMGEGRKSVTWRALHLEGLRAALEDGQSDPDATADRIAGDVGMRRALADLILMGQWNDLTQCTWGYDNRAMPGPHGRSLPFRAVHDDIRKAIERGDAPRRSVDVGTPQNRGDGSARERSDGDTREFTWIPFLDRPKLLAGHIEVDGGEWPDGVSLLEPPPEVRALGIHIPGVGIVYHWRTAA